MAWRNITAKYPDYEVGQEEGRRMRGGKMGGALQAVVYDDNNFYSDQVMALPDTAIQSMGIALVFMALICAVFIMHGGLVYWVTLLLLSMDVGIIGALSWWGSDLSPTTIVNLLMSIGLSVDFATHVAYRFHRVPLFPLLLLCALTPTVCWRCRRTLGR